MAVTIMGIGAFADGKTSEDTLVERAQIRAIENQLMAEAEAIESRNDKIELYVNYLRINGVSAKLIENEVYVPVVHFSEAMADCTVSFDMKTLNITADGLTFEAVIGAQYFTANGRYFFQKQGIEQDEDGQIRLPLSIMAKIFGCEYYFDVDSKSAYLKSSGEFLEDGESYYDKEDLYWLSRIINAESRGEPFIGQIAGGTVVMNRTVDSKFPDTVHGVVFDGAQFSPAVSGSVNMEPSEQCVIVAKIVLEGYRLNDNILFFYAMAKDSVLRDGFEDTDTEMVIGNHYFYTYYNKR
jgi:N-acetylmuramoyl-L-alanine amidase